MTVRDRLLKWFKRTGSEVLGWILIPVGIVMMPAPGPGMLVLVAGVALLAPHYAWARRARDFLKDRAIEGAQYGVATVPRIVVSALGGVWLFAAGIVWWASPTIPEVDLVDFDFGPQLPGVGWVGGLVLLVLAVAAWLGRGPGGAEGYAAIRRPALSVVAVLLVALAVVWFIGPDIGRQDVNVHLGPQLPAAGWGTGLGLMVSAVAAWGLLVYSVKRWRP